MLSWVESDSLALNFIPRQSGGEVYFGTEIVTVRILRTAPGVPISDPARSLLLIKHTVSETGAPDLRSRMVAVPKSPAGCNLTPAPFFLPRLPQGGEGRGEEANVYKYEPLAAR